MKPRVPVMQVGDLQPFLAAGVGERGGDDRKVVGDEGGVAGDRRFVELGGGDLRGPRPQTLDVRGHDPFGAEQQSSERFEPARQLVADPEHAGGCSLGGADDVLGQFEGTGRKRIGHPGPRGPAVPLDGDFRSAHSFLRKPVRFPKDITINLGNLASCPSPPIRSKTPEI